MTVDIFKRRTAGDPINGMPADLFNSLQEMLRWYLRVRSRANAREGALQLDVELSIKNDSGGPLDQYAVVRTAGDPVIYPRDADTSYYGDVAVNSLAPIAGQPFAILQRPSIDGEIVPAICDGLTLCRLKLNDSSHGYAECVTDEYGHLESKSNTGPARIVWAGEDDSTQLDGAINDTVTTFTVDDLTDLIVNVPFVIIIGTEEINVTEVDDDGVTILDCERGYNSTTAASHADNATVTLTGGIVWALVSLERSVSSYHFAVSLTTITAASGTTLGSGTATLYSVAGGVMTATGTVVAVRNPCAEIAASWKLHLHRDPESGELLALPLCEFTEGSGGDCSPCATVQSTYCVILGDQSIEVERVNESICVWVAIDTSTPIDVLSGWEYSILLYYEGGRWRVAFSSYTTANFTYSVVNDEWDCDTNLVLDIDLPNALSSYLPASITVIPGACGSGSGGACDVTVSFDDADLDITATGFYIAGTGFSTTPGDNVVTLNLGAACTVVGATSTLLTVTFDTQPTSTGSLTAIVTVGACDSGAAVQVATVVAVLYGGTGDACTAEEIPSSGVEYTSTVSTGLNAWYFLTFPSGPNGKIEIVVTSGTVDLEIFYSFTDCSGASSADDPASASSYCYTMVSAGQYYFLLTGDGTVTITYTPGAVCP